MGNFDKNLDPQYSQLLLNYGIEYLQETNPDIAPYYMEDFNEIFSDSYEAVKRAFFGYDYNPYRSGSDNRESFNPNRDYFAFNGYANLVSIGEIDLVYWLDSNIDYQYFIDYCKEHGYID